LAQALAERVGYTEFSRAAERLLRKLPAGVGTRLEELTDILSRAGAVSEVASGAPPLLSIASYFSYDRGTKELAKFLYERFADVSDPTGTHKLIAAAAKLYLDKAEQEDEDYVIVTTNYDRLMEAALSAANVPVSKKQPFLVRVRFDPLAGDVQRLQERNKPLPPESFILKRPKPLAILFKMHGTISTVEEGQETTILSDEDYIAYMERNGEHLKMLPSYIHTLISDTPFLFLGYSFSDWNVRSLYHSLVRDRPENEDSPDCAVIREENVFENVFFRERKIDLLVTTLEKFAEGVNNARS
jgi:NAD-dependent SIR2 family protein deacetylase